MPIFFSFLKSNVSKCGDPPTTIDCIFAKTKMDLIIGRNYTELELIRLVEKQKKKISSYKLFIKSHDKKPHYLFFI